MVTDFILYLSDLRMVPLRDRTRRPAAVSTVVTEHRDWISEYSAIVQTVAELYQARSSGPHTAWNESTLPHEPKKTQIHPARIKCILFVVKKLSRRLQKNDTT